jgi:RNA polymerase sigma-70 factor (ECF subfamily)
LRAQPAIDLAAPAAEGALLARARAGSGEAFAALVRAYDRPLRALAFRLLEDEASMDDALQDAYVKAFRSLRAFAGDAAFGTWLYRIVYNTCLDELRRRKRRPHLRLVDELESLDPRSMEAETVERTSLEDALAALEPELRAVVLLVDADELTYDEAAEALGIAPGTVASRLSRARRALRPLLEGDRHGH